MRQRKLTLAVAGALASAAGSAQDAAPETTMERIEVVGSRIKRVDVETSQPVFVIERADIERTGLTAIGDILQQIVFHGEDLNTRINNGGNGEVRVSLRNLGSNRTLVLVNGRRWASTLDGAVDLSQIPAAIVERIEVLKDGASAIYGSDAIAGVINIITRKDYDGIEAGVYYGQYDAGDGQTQAYDFTWGHDFTRGNLAANLSYQRQDAVSAGNRARTAVQYVDLPANNSFLGGASLTTPNGRFIVPDLDNGGFEDFPAGLTLIDGRDGTSPDDFRIFDFLEDGYNFAPQNHLLTPAERIALFAQGRYELGERTTLGVDLLYNERRSNQRLAPSPLQINPDFSGAQGNIGIAAGNLYNPFGVDIDEFERRFVEGGPRVLAEEVETLRVVTAVDGMFDVLDRTFSWDVHAAHTRAHRDDRLRGVIDLQAFANAVGPSFRDAQGVARCGVPGDVVPGCVPANLFGGAGSITPDMVAYIAATAHGSAEDRQSSVAADVSGNVFTLPHGPLALALGVEHRRLSSSETPDPLSTQGRIGGGGGNGLGTEGGYGVDEAYLELNVPLLADLPFAQVLEVNVAARASDYSNFGQTINAKAGFRWKPHADLLVRGNWAQGFRAPSVSELFAGVTQDAFRGVIPDPCQPREPAPAATPEVLARCAAAGVPAVFNAGQRANLTSGGNPDLQPETAVSRTLGLIYSPGWWKGLDLYLDWYRFQIDDAINGLDAETLVNRCYVVGDPDACARITRAADGHLFLVDTTLQNVRVGLETEGFDLGIAWRIDTSLGRFALRWDTAYVDYFGTKGRPARLTRLPDGTLLFGNAVGGGPAFDIFGAEWRIKSNLNIAWSRGAYGVSATGRYFSQLEEDCRGIVNYARFFDQPELRALCDSPDRVIDLNGDGVGERAAQHIIDATVFIDLQATWDAPWDAHLVLGVNNAFDRDPPVSRAAFANSTHPAYDIPGRFIYGSYTQRF